MSLNRYAKKKDRNQDDIIISLESVGAEVWIIGLPVDLLVRFRGMWHLLEVKGSRKKDGTIAHRKGQERQTQFIASTGCPVVTTPSEALEAIGAILKSVAPSAIPLTEPGSSTTAAIALR